MIVIHCTAFYPIDSVPQKKFTDLADPPNTFRLSAEAETILGELKVNCIFSEPPPAGLKFTGSATWACPSDG